MGRQPDALPTKLVCDHMLSLSSGVMWGSASCPSSLVRPFGFRKLTSGPLPERPNLRYLLPPILNAQPVSQPASLQTDASSSLQAKATWLEAVAFSLKWCTANTMSE